MFSAGGLGTMLGGLWIARRGRTQGLTRVILGHAAAALIGLAVFSLSPYLWLTLAALVVTGTGLVVATAASMSLIQIAVDSDVRAQVLSMASVIGVGAPALSAIGWLASKLGVQAPLLGAAAAGILIWLLLAPGVRRQAAHMERLGTE
jgi:hypothetical protein